MADVSAGRALYRTFNPMVRFTFARASARIVGNQGFGTVGGSSEESAGTKAGSMICTEKASKAELAPLPPDEVAKRAADHHFGAELNEIAKLALPIVLTNLGQVAMMATDLAFIGRMGAEATAAAALAGRIYWISVTFGMGMIWASASFAAQAFGANNLSLLRRSLRMGLWTGLMLSLPIVIFQLRGEYILLAFGQAPEAALLAQHYLSGVAWSVPPVLSFFVIRTFMGALNRQTPVLWITLAGIPLNALLVYLLMYGNLGLPRLELFGVGLATTVVNISSLLAALWFVTMARPFSDYRALAQFWRLDWSLMRQLVVIGIPISMSLLVESGISSAAALLMGLISTKAVAANQVAFQVSAFFFMISSGLGMAATVRVAHAVGRNDGVGVKRTSLAAMLLGIGIVAVLTLGVIAARFEIAELFLGELVDDADAAIGLGAHLLLVGASAFISAAVYTIASGSLRGMKDTRVPLLFAGIAYWIIGVSLSYLLGLKIGLGATGVCIGLSIGAAGYAVLLVWRLKLLVRRLALAKA
ncbi:MATE family efflux transporter [Bradyrhizobium brasilense]|uniref:Multidrug-efflux transporter n=1 Tax=Bradyrhizobium brasilense TaxID=1419277 RepID=A0ABY8JAF4_9BRAD|nr:MATE family efflux transporter [Bradyrhizobium brasilense]WFU62542.1 MATE family efflux transporter [Bradyrhizobium brasilense]